MSEPTLSQLRQTFTKNLTNFLTWCQANGYKVALDQIKRTQAEAAANAASGAGISNSLHCLGLAADILLYDAAGNYLSDTTSYKSLGTQWKTYDPLNRWGGDFVSRQDGNHFSMEHGGVM